MRCSRRCAGVGGVAAVALAAMRPSWWAFALPLVSAGAFGLWGILERATAERGTERSASYDRAVERGAVDGGGDRICERDRDGVRGARRVDGADSQLAYRRSRMEKRLIGEPRRTATDTDRARPVSRACQDQFSGSQCVAQLVSVYVVSSNRASLLPTESGSSTNPSRPCDRPPARRRTSPPRVRPRRRRSAASSAHRR